MNTTNDLFSAAASDQKAPSTEDFHFSALAFNLLEDLYRSRSRKCVCHSAADLCVPEKQLYPVLAVLIAGAWVDFVLPEKQESYYLDFDDDDLREWELQVKKSEVRKIKNAAKLADLIGAFKRTGTDASFPEAYRHVYQIFLKIGVSDMAPRYYMRITPKGEQRLNIETEWRLSKSAAA